MLDINFNIAYRHAREMASCADEVNHQQTKLSKIIDDLRGAWRGETSAAYIRKLEAFCQKLQKEAKGYRDDATAFRLRIDEIKKAEEEAASALASIGS